LVIKAHAPASTSNLGPGFDCLGGALDLGLVATLTDAPASDNGLVGRAVEAVTGHKLDQAIEIESGIPVARGLGSSGACVAAGLLIGCALASRTPDPDELMRIGTPIEGHPDNLAAALFGGLTIALPSGVVFALPPSASVRPFILLPHERLSTEEARRALPDAVPLGDAVANIAAVSGLIALLTGATEPTRDRLFACTQDRIHQPYRAPLMERTAAAVEALRDAGLPAVVSGAGPSVLCLVTRDDEDSVRGTAGTLEGWQLMELNWDTRGAYIEGE
jgi:homoserine kinase